MTEPQRIPWLTLALAGVLGLGGLRLALPGRSRYRPPARLEEAVLRIATRQLPNTLDWNLSNDSSGPNYPVARATMRGLLTWNERQERVLDAAEAYGTDNPERPVRYTFRLRPDVTWSDGAPLVAEDFVLAWHRALDGKDSKYFSDIEGVPAYLALHEAPDVTEGERAAALARVAIRALDARTLEVRLAGPRSYFTGYLAGVYAFYPAPSHVLSGLTEEQVRAYYRRTGQGHPLALGPYRIADWNRLDESLELVANPAFPPLAGRIPKVLLFPSDLAPVLYQQGRVDFTFLDDGPSTFGHPEDRRTAALWSTFWLGFNTRAVPLEVRRAIAMGLDKRRLGDQVLPRFRVADQQLPEGFPYRLPAGDPRLQALPCFDPAQARRLVAAAGWAGRDLTLVFHETGTFLPEAALAEGIRVQLAALGLRITTLGTQDMAGEMLTRDRHSRHELFLRRSGADFPHPQEFLMVFRSGGDPAQANGSFTEFEGSGEAYDRFQRAALGTAEASDPAALASRAWEAERVLLAEQVVVVPLFYPDRYYRSRPWLRDLVVDPFNFIDFRRLTCRTEAAP